MLAYWLARIAVFAIAMVAVLGPGTAHADQGGLAVCVTPQSRFATPAAAFAGHGYDCTTDQYQFGPGDYWALSAPIPPARAKAGEPLRVQIASLWQDSVTLYALYADGKVAVTRTTSANIARHMQLGATIEFDLPTRAAPVTRLLWRVDGASNARGILFGQRVITRAASERGNLTMAGIYAGFAGLAIALLVYNLAIWVALRHRFQLVYCAMVATLLVYAFSSSGVIAWAIPTIDNNIRIRINYGSLSLAAAGAMLFARTFFEPHIFSPWLRRFVNVSIGVLAAGGILFWLLSWFALPVANIVYPWSFVLGLTATFPLLWAAWRHGSRYLTLFAIAWAAPILFSMARVLDALRILPGGFWLDNSTVLTLGLESLLSSLAITYRIQMLSRERDDALAGEALARRMADTDPLTGLLNRRAFLAQAIGRDGPQALHVLDIDHFKRVNETLGHDGGDEVLRLFARVLRSATPSHALIARLGGEEFAIVTHAMDPLDPERLLARLRSARFPFDLTVTASIGSCTGPLTSDVDWKRLYHNADRALFDAKAAGRDRAREGVPVPLAA